MSVKPILFNTDMADMVRAILDGRKTVTRRAIKGRVPLNDWNFYKLHDNKDGVLTCSKDKLCAGFYQDRHIFYVDGEKHIDAHYYCAPYQPGDILYVRETWGYDVGGTYIYKATYEEGLTGLKDVNAVGKKIKWHPSIHMPKEAARIWLKVTDVRVERLQDITWEDGYKEGIENPAKFNELWDSTIKKKDLPLYGWDANPYVWVIEFERTVKPKCI